MRPERLLTAVVLILLALRIPRIRKGIASFRSGRLLPFFNRTQRQAPIENTAGTD